MQYNFNMLQQRQCMRKRNIRGIFVKSLLLWINNKYYYIFYRVRVRSLSYPP
jgi:hypothetical protein